jgi:hypothetical protein
VCDVKWLGLRASQIAQLSWIGAGDILTSRDRAILRTLAGRQRARRDCRILQEYEAMEIVGKHELQCLFGHPDGIKYFSSTFLPQAILQCDYF